MLRCSLFLAFLYSSEAAGALSFLSPYVESPPTGLQQCLKFEVLVDYIHSLPLSRGNISVVNQLWLCRFNLSWATNFQAHPSHQSGSELHCSRNMLHMHRSTWNLRCINRPLWTVHSKFHFLRCCDNVITTVLTQLLKSS
jgi:hypothetical protein